MLAAYSGYIRDMMSLQGNRHYNKIPLLGVKKNIAWNVIQALYRLVDRLGLVISK